LHSGSSHKKYITVNATELYDSWQLLNFSIWYMIPFKPNSFILIKSY
jgi:hypothetical protein